MFLMSCGQYFAHGMYSAGWNALISLFLPAYIFVTPRIEGIVVSLAHLLEGLFYLYNQLALNL